jgi:hypothetical protein
MVDSNLSFERKGCYYRAMKIASRFDSKSLFLYLKKNGKHTSTFIFAFGFIIDFIFLPSVAHPLTPFIGLAYGIGFGITLLCRSFVLNRSKGDVFTSKISSVLSLFLAYFSGSLLSYIFVLYYRSSYLASAIPFFLFALFVIFANEYIKSKKYRTYLDISIFFFTLTALALFLVPFVTGSVSNIVFVSSLLLAAVLSLLYAYLLGAFTQVEIVQKKILYMLALWAPLAFGFLYATESVPPLPVSVTGAHVYHSVEKIGNTYKVSEEVRSGLSTVLHVREGNPLYFFTTIFAPIRIEAPIEHVWELYDESSDSWEEKTKVSFEILGGREEGYRGYSRTTETTPGRWRVSVYLDGKRLLGRHYFSLESTQPKQLRSITR